AKKNTVAMPVSKNAHHTQLPATPPVRTRLVTRFGVSVLKVVATSEMPISHHGACLPATKNSAVFFPARFASTSAGTNMIPTETTMMTQSSVVRCMRRRSAHRKLRPLAMHALHHRVIAVIGDLRREPAMQRRNQ